MKKIIILFCSTVIMLLFAHTTYAQTSQQFMSEDEARYFLSFIYNYNYEYDDIKNDQYFKMLTGKLEDKTNADEIKLSFLTTMQAQINNNIDKSSYNCDILRSDLQSYLEEKAAGMTDLPEQEYNKVLNKQLGIVENALVDWLCSITATKAGIYVTDDMLKNIKLVSNSYSDLIGAPKKAIKYADYVINGVKAAMLPINEELTGRYSYFSVYLTNRKAYFDDTTFDIIMDYNKLAITQNYPLGTIDWYIGSKDSWVEHIDDIERWADVVIQVENSITGVSDGNSSGNTTPPAPENTVITFNKDTYISDASEYVGCTWDLNGYTVVIDSDLVMSKNININGGALIITGNMNCYSSLNLNNGYLIVEGNLSQHHGGSINVSDGKLKVNGNFMVTGGSYDAGSGRTEVGGDFIYSSSKSSSFKMKHDGAYVLVRGDFTIDTGYNEGNIIAGILELKGNFTQRGSHSALGSEPECYGFPASGTHGVILSGEQEQIVSFGDSKRSCFNILESTNPNVIFETEATVKSGIADKSVFKTLKLYNANLFDNAVIEVGEDLYIGGNVTINSSKLNIKGNAVVSEYGKVAIGTGVLNIGGNFVQNNSSSSYGVYVENGQLIVGGNYTATCGVFDAGAGITKISGDFLLHQTSFHNFHMKDDAAYIFVNGDFDIKTGTNSGYITAGTLEVKGNFTQHGYYSSVGYSPNYGGFPASGRHKVILSGEEEQIVSFDAPKYSYFNILVNKNLNVKYNTDYRYKYLFNEEPYIVIIETNTDDGIIIKVLDSTVENTISTQIKTLGTLSKTGYIFNGWYLDEEYTIPLTDENDVITSDLTLYAKWIEPIKFDSVICSSENRTLSATVAVCNEIQQQKGIVIIAVYDENSLIDFYHTDAELSVSNTFSNLPSVENGYTVKAFCWTDMKTIVPLCSPISTTVQ